jgi:hypothetical protein
VRNTARPLDGRRPMFRVLAPPASGAAVPWQSIISHLCPIDP